MKYTFKYAFTLMLSLVTVLTVANAQTGRTIIDFNEDWRFKQGIPAWSWRYKYGDNNWEKVKLPHDWSIKGPFDKNAVAGGYGAYLPTGSGVYRKTFKLAEEDADKKIFIEFDGVYMNSEVYCNGVLLGKRPSGYIGFSYDITPYVQYGSFENKIIVVVDNSTPVNSRWYSGSGITRNVRLVKTNKLYIPQWGSYVYSPKAEKNEAVVVQQLNIVNEENESRKVTVVSSVLDAGNRVVQKKSTSVLLKKNENKQIDMEFEVKNPARWSLDSPHLYKIRTEILSDNQKVDTYDSSFGIRKSQFTVDGYFLNDEYVKIKGVCLHHDGGAVGAAVPPDLWKRRLLILKEMGCNAIRTSHNAFDPGFYDLCDEMGFLVMDEFFDEWTAPKLRDVTNGYNLYFQEWWERDLRDAIVSHRNHPSIIIYSAGNEVIEQNRPEGVDIAKKIRDVYHKYDATRPVTCGNNMMVEANLLKFSDVFDVVGYNYGPQFEMYDIDKKTYPERKFIGTESTRGLSTRGVYVFPFNDNSVKPYKTKEGYFSSYDFLYRRFGQEHEWKVTNQHPYISGMFIWTGFDYLGETDWPRINADFGAIDRCGFPKDAYYFYKSQWSNQPVLHLLPHWNWNGYEGKTIPVWAYTNCDEVELFLNGRSVGRKKMSSSNTLHLSWEVPYTPGELKGIGYKNGKVVLETTVVTAGDACKFVVNTDKKLINANDKDLFHVEISLTDSKGNFIPDSNAEFEIQISGPAKLLAVDNGDPLFKKSFQDSSSRLFNGRALAILQSTKMPGKISVVVKNHQLKSSEKLVLETR